ncbi:4847_t:CDS:10, partial [Acaulospora colombiana]
IKEEGEIYIEVNEEEYQSRIREELKTNGFIEDDDGKAYLYAEDDLGKEYSEGSESELECDYDESLTKDGKRKRTRTRKMADEKSSDLVRPEQRINSFFQRAATQLLKPKMVKTTEEERTFMENLLQELDDETGDQDLDITRIPISYNHNSYKEHEVRISSQSSDTIMNDQNDQNYSARDCIPIDLSSKNGKIGQVAESAPMDLVNDYQEDFDFLLNDEIEYTGSVHTDGVVSIDSINPPQGDQGMLVTLDRNDSNNSNRPSISEKNIPMEIVENNRKNMSRFANDEIEYTDYAHINDTVTVGNVNPLKDQEIDGNTNRDDITKFYWIDSYEKQGIVYLFGKNNNETEIEVRFEDVFKEVEEIREKYKISKIEAKNVTRKYAFELPDVPAQSDYLKSFDQFLAQSLPSDLSGKTFSRVFGTQSSALELFLIKRRIRGPCWLEVKNAMITQKKISWCKVELTIENPKHINPMSEVDLSEPLKPPPLKIMSLSLRTVMNHQKHVNEHYPFYLLAIIKQNDPDVIVGHNFIGFDLDVLLHRMKVQKIKDWSSLGRLHRQTFPLLHVGSGKGDLSSLIEKDIVSGRLICDTYQSAKEFIKSKNFSLTELVSSHLNITRKDIDYEKVASNYDSAEALYDMILHCRYDSILTSELMFKLQLLPLTKQLTNLSDYAVVNSLAISTNNDVSYVRSKTLNGARANRNDFLLLHEFHKLKYICPDKYSHKSKSKAIVGEDDEEENIKGARKKPTYAGGLVLEPKTGFYDKFVVLLDFNSLYPSIIQEYNICFTTVVRTDPGGEDHVPEAPGTDMSQGVLPRLIANLVERRRQVKKCMKSPNISASERDQYDVRQRALKLTANSMYGCLGTKFSRFYAKPLAMLITSKGREILQNTVELAESENMQVLYGDTDSIMICTNASDIKEAMEVGKILRKKVNERYRLIEIEVEGFFEKLLLLKKKKYAAIKLEVDEITSKTKNRVPETKGLDLVLAKAPEDYPDAKSQPHVQVALRMKKRGLSARQGDTIPYVICKKTEDMNAPNNLFEKAFHPDEVRHDTNLQIDSEWYLTQQVHASVTRLIEPIDGTDSARIAECLGIDSPRSLTTNAPSTFRTFESRTSDEERFKNVDKLYLKCVACKQSHIYEGLNSDTAKVKMKMTYFTWLLVILTPINNYFGCRDVNSMCQALFVEMKIVEVLFPYRRF